MLKQYHSIPYFFAIFFAIAIYSFYQSYFGHIPDFQNIVSPISNRPISITNLTHFHAIMMVLWFLILIIQPILIIKKKVAWHRMLGKISYLVVAVLIISMLLVIHQTHDREKNIPVFAANLFDFPVFVVFYGLAIYYRKKTTYHSRFMIMSILPFINPALARLQIGGLPIQLGFWVAFFVVEYFNRKVYKPYLIGLGYFLFNLGVVAYLFLGNPKLLENLWSIFWE